MINLEFQDKTGTPIKDINMGMTMKGRESNPQIIRIFNNGDEDVKGVRLWCGESASQEGNADDTYLSAYLSTDGRLYNNNIYLNIDINTFKEVYIQWRPPSTSVYGNKQWTLFWHINPANIELTCEN